MTSFDDRKKAQEDKHAYDQEFMFKARARAAKLFGQWSASQFGADADAYAADLVNLAAGGKQAADLVKKVEDDAKAKGKALTPELLSEKYERCLQEAKTSISSK